MVCSSHCDSESDGEHLHGMMSSPLLMAMSAARRGTPVMLVPSMHDDLAEDPVTERLVKDLRGRRLDPVVRIR